MKCIICKKEVRRNRGNQKTCLNEECQRKSKLAHLKEYRKTDRWKELQKKHRQTDKFKATNKKWRKESEKYRRYQRAYMRASNKLINKCNKQFHIFLKEELEEEIKNRP